jgi:PKHD-type hydroxylase
VNLKNYYWYFPSAVPTRICDEIIKYAISIKDQKGITGGFRNAKKLDQQQVKDLKKKRDSNIVWLNERWIYREIHPYVHQANKNAGWNFQWDFSEACQFTKYNKGQYYGWHCDGWDKPYHRKDEGPSLGKIRKLSVTVSLSDEKDYTGGELEFDYRNLDPDKKPNIKKCKEILPKGSLVVFPADLWHRVCPVKEGTRYSLVMWSLGWPFK